MKHWKSGSKKVFKMIQVDLIVCFRGKRMWVNNVVHKENYSTTKYKIDLHDCVDSI